MARSKQTDKQIIDRIKEGRTRSESTDELAQLIRSGNRSALARGITLVESTQESNLSKAEELLRILLPHSGNSFRVGISGVPGAGKSTFIESFGISMIQTGKKVAVLAIDPSSETGKGSILGDKTRMNELASHASAFIRPSPSSGSLGGVARKTREAIFLCEAAGYDLILIETVGVGQSETAVHSMVDFFVLIAIAGAGDELQGIKRGIMEMADLVVMNKADGDNLPRAKAARQDVQRALHFFPELPSGWIPEVTLASSLERTGLDSIADSMNRYQQHCKTKGYFDLHRKEQSRWWLRETIQHALVDLFFSQENIQTEIAQREEQIISQQQSVSEAARYLIELFKGTGINPK
jgi:LAO/AO transport system kinase